MLWSGGLPSNREIAHVCAWYASSCLEADLPWVVMTYRLQSTRWCEVETPEPIFRSCGILILSATGKKWFRCLSWIARAPEPIAARGPAHWRRSRCIDRFLGRTMTRESKSVKSSPGSISQPIHLTLQNPSRSNSLIGQEKRLLQTPIVPKCKPTKSQIKGQCHGVTVDTGWDTWHCG